MKSEPLKMNARLVLGAFPNFSSKQVGPTVNREIEGKKKGKSGSHGLYVGHCAPWPYQISPIKVRGDTMGIVWSDKNITGYQHHKNK